MARVTFKGPLKPLEHWPAGERVYVDAAGRVYSQAVGSGLPAQGSPYPGGGGGGSAPTGGGAGFVGGSGVAPPTGIMSAVGGGGVGTPLSSEPDRQAVRLANRLRIYCDRLGAPGRWLLRLVDLRNDGLEEPLAAIEVPAGTSGKILELWGLDIGGWEISAAPNCSYATEPHAFAAVRREIDVSIAQPRKKCPDCTDGTYRGLLAVEKCATCQGTMTVPDSG